MVQLYQNIHIKFILITLPTNNISHRKTNVKRFYEKKLKNFLKNFQKIYKNLLTYTKRYVIIGVQNSKSEGQNRIMKKKVLKIVAICGLFSMFTFSGCASCERELKSCSSDVAGGLYRVVNIYTYDGQLIATYEGKIDIDENENGSIMFDMNGKRYVYYNAIIEVIEK